MSKSDPSWHDPRRYYDKVLGYINTHNHALDDGFQDVYLTLQKMQFNAYSGKVETRVVCNGDWVIDRLLV